MTAALPPPGSAPLATITGNDLLLRLDAVAQAIQAIAIKVDALPAAVADHEARLRTVELASKQTEGLPVTVADHETRLRGLERRIYLATGASATLGAAVGWALQLVNH